MTPKDRQQLRAEIADMLADWRATHARWKARTIRAVETIRAMCSRRPPE